MTILLVLAVPVVAGLIIAKIRWDKKKRKRYEQMDYELKKKGR